MTKSRDNFSNLDGMVDYFTAYTYNIEIYHKNVAELSEAKVEKSF